jgi:hypothetical protein
MAEITSPGTTAGGESERARVRALLRAEQPGQGRAPMLVRLCEVAVDELRMSGAAVSLMTEVPRADDQTGTIAAASSERARWCEELEFSLGEGPGTDAFAASRPILTSDLEGAVHRWPGYAPAAYAAGVRATFAFPLLVGAARFGVLHLHSPEVRHLTGDDIATILMLAELAVEVVLDAFSPSAHPAADARLLGSGDHRDAIYQAQGMVMVQLRVSLAEALARMRAHAFAEDQDLGELAADILAGRLRLHLDPEGAS